MRTYTVFNGVCKAEGYVLKKVFSNPLILREKLSEFFLRGLA